MTPERGKLLAELLKEVVEKDAGYFPDEAWHAIHGAVNIPYCEVAVVRHEKDVWKVFMKRMRPDDIDFPGDPWEIPGGMFRATFNSRDEAVETIAKKDIGVPVKDIQEVMTTKWKVSRGNGISHVCVCRESDARAGENERAKFFARNEIPSPLAPYHDIFTRAVFDYLESGRYPAQ